MSKIEEIQMKFIYPHESEWDYENVELAMKEYAEWYAKKCLYLADVQINVYEEIVHATDLKLPEHE